MATDAVQPNLLNASDLGFGAVVSNRRGYRLINRDGSFNVQVLHRSWLDVLFSYHNMLTMSWPRFFLVLSVGYLMLNTVFASAYLAAGHNALGGDAHISPVARAFFFSVYTFATIGYGNVVPETMTANVIVTAESLIGLLAIAVSTGIVFARFSRPVPNIRYSRQAIIAPYRGITSLQFRVVNARASQLVNVDAVVMFSRFEGQGSQRARKYYQLSLERDRVAFFPLNWTLVHPIDEKSPLWGWDKQALLDAEAEIAVLLTAVDETFAQTVHTRSFYTADEFDFGRRFELMYEAATDSYVIDLDKLDSTYSVELSTPVQ